MYVFNVEVQDERRGYYAHMPDALHDNIGPARSMERAKMLCKEYCSKYHDINNIVWEYDSDHQVTGTVTLEDGKFELRFFIDKTSLK